MADQDDYLEGEPESHHRPFVQNLKVANARRLLQLLKQVDKKDFSTWVEYANVALVPLHKEIESAMAADPGLAQDYYSFVNVWGQDYLEALQEVVKRTKQDA